MTPNLILDIAYHNIIDHVSKSLSIFMYYVITD